MRTATASYYIYVLFRENGAPFYIGKGRGSRWIDHVYLARTGYPGYRYNLIREMLSRNTEIIKAKLHEELTEEVAFAYERALIAAIGRYPNGPLLNFTDGGEGPSGRTPSAKMLAVFRASPSPETRAKLAEAARNRRQKPTKIKRGWGKSPETRAKMSEAALRRPPEHNAKIAAALRGKPKSSEHRAKLSAAKLKGRRAIPST